MLNDLLVEEREVNNLLDNGINRIKQLIDRSNPYNNKYYYSNSPMLSEKSLINNLYQEKEDKDNDEEFNTVEIHHGANLEKLQYKNIELNDYLLEIRKANAELIHFIGLQKSDFRELGIKYQNMSEDYYHLFDRYQQSEQIREEQNLLIQTMQNELDSLRGIAVNSPDMFSNKYSSIDAQDEKSYYSNSYNYDNLRISGGKYKTLEQEKPESKSKLKKKNKSKVKNKTANGDNKKLTTFKSTSKVKGSTKPLTAVTGKLNSQFKKK